MRDKLKKILKFLFNPKLLLCLGIAWMLTNGWSYVLLSIGTWLGIEWMIAVSGAYMAFLWFPFTPEKLITIVIAMALLRWLFPRDQKTLQVLKDMQDKAKRAFANRKKQKQDEKGEKHHNI